MSDIDVRTIFENETSYYLTQEFLKNKKYV